VSTPNFRPRPSAQQRGSQRVLLSISILITGEREYGAPFAERPKTQVVSAHGALLQLRESVLEGQQLRMKNLSTNEEISCTVMDIQRGNSDISEIGVAFSEPCPRFWRVSFPPDHWSTRSPEVKRMSGESLPAKPALAKK
jgi:PilZ domain